MNLLRTYATALLVILTMGVSACRRDELSTPLPTPSEEANGGNKISFNVDIEGLPAEDLRMILQEEMDGNKHAGLKFVWNPGDTEVLWIAFKTESRTPVARSTFVKVPSLFSDGRGLATKLVSM